MLHTLNQKKFKYYGYHSLSITQSLFLVAF